jgi:hypothetical protein
MSNQLTYIFGAGASYQSIPIVKTFNKRLLEFKEYLKNKGNPLSGDDRHFFYNAADSIQELFNEFSSHQSFDTYFKKLFHFGNVDAINSGKRLLNLYFSWEHSKSSMNYVENLREGDFRKQSLFDKRYDALIAGLLEPISGKSQPMCEVNFITWNYDINLLHSVKNFFYPDMIYSEFFHKIKKGMFSWEIDGKIRIVNINGYFYSSGFNNCPNLTNVSIDEIIEKKVRDKYCESKEIDEDANKIKFAWEVNEVDRNSLNDYLSEIIAKTENVIIIGYTFPLYNRLIDLKYLKQEDLVKKNIIIQDPNAEVIKQNLLDVYRLNNVTKIQTISDCDSFYIPSSIFGISDYKQKFVHTATSI